MTEDTGTVLVFLGAPGAGKGTVISFLSRSYPVKQVSTGDLVREKMKKEEEFKARVGEKVNRGELLADEIVEKLLKKELAKIPLEKTIALDGYPRTLTQAKNLESILPEFNRELKKVVYLNVSEETVLKRLGGRRQCRECGAIYNIHGMKPKKEGVCDKCGGELFIREDDKEEVIKKRLKEYWNKTAPLIEHYKEKGLLFEVNANKEAEESAAKILSELEDK